MSKGEWNEWANAARESAEYVSEQAKLDFALAIERRMAQAEINKAALARILCTSAAAVTMALRGDANLTIDRMARMAHALDATLHIHVAPRSASVRWLECHQFTPLPAGGESPDLAKKWAKSVTGATDDNAIVGAA